MEKETSDLKAKLKKADPIVRKYVVELEKRNEKLQAQMVKLEADKRERDYRIKALQKGEYPEKSLEEIREEIGRIRPRIIDFLEEEGYKVIPPAI